MQSALFDATATIESGGQLVVVGHDEERLIFRLRQFDDHVV